MRRRNIKNSITIQVKFIIQKLRIKLIKSINSNFGLISFINRTHYHCVHNSYVLNLYESVARHQ